MITPNPRQAPPTPPLLSLSLVSSVQSFSFSPSLPIFIKSSQRSSTLLSPLFEDAFLGACAPLLHRWRVYGSPPCHQFIPSHGQYSERTFRASVTRARAHTHAHVNRARATLPVVLCRNSTHFLQRLAPAPLEGEIGAIDKMCVCVLRKSFFFFF